MLTAELQAHLNMLSSDERRELLEGVGASTGGVTNPLSYINGQNPNAFRTGGWAEIDDRADGDFMPFWNHEIDHLATVFDGRMVSTAVTMGVSIIQTLENYTIGKGGTYSVTPKRQDATGIAAFAEKIILNFLDANDWWDDTGRETEIHTTSRKDGEVFVALIPRKGGHLAMRLVAAENVRDPGGTCNEMLVQAGIDPNKTSSKYGVVSPSYDSETRLGYFTVWDTSRLQYRFHSESDWRQGTAMRNGLLHHIKRNTERRVKRGLSDFFPVQEQILDDAKLLTNTGKGAAAQAAIAWIEQYKAASESQAAEIVNKSLNSDSSRVTANESARVKRANTALRKRSIAPGTILTIGQGLEYQAGPMGAERNAGFEIVNALMARRIGIRWSMPEWVISADASNANRATAEVADEPFVRAREKDQGFYAGHSRKILWKVLAYHVYRGDFLRVGIRSLNQLRQAVDIGVVYTPVATRNRKEQAETNEILSERGIISDDTWRQEVTDDAEQEKAKLKQEGAVVEQQRPVQKTFWEYP